MHGIPLACQDQALQGDEGRDGQEALGRGGPRNKALAGAHGPGRKEGELDAGSKHGKEEDGLHEAVQG